MIEQPAAPYLDAVIGYGARGPGRFHVPGHKGGPGADPGLRFGVGERALWLDIPQDIWGVDLGPSPTPYEEAERLAAEAHGAARTWFLTNGATQGNHALALALAPLGARVVAQRNSHASLVDGLVLSGGVPAFVPPAYDAELGMAHGVEPAALERALAAAPDARAAFIVSPTYYGMAADVAGCVEVAHAAGVPLVADQSWGPHFGFHDALPPSALAQGADAVLTSTHKIAGALTQAAMLHVGRGGRVDAGAVARAIRLVRSTSPSSLLLASLDGARRQLALHGEQLLHETLQAIDAARTKLAGIPSIALVDSAFVGRPGVAGYDPLRIVLDVRETGRTGYEVADALRRSYDVNAELATQATVVFVVGIAERAETLLRLAGDVEEVVKRIAREGSTAAIVQPPASLHNEMAVPPRDAFLGPAEEVAVDAAVGRVSCESIAGYPPGIPALLPGERITAETVSYLRELVASGARLHGASDPRFERVHVLLEEER
ncbi:MAG: arginine decarboxylase [Solirubrobacteraceae bacterium]|jgi:arginine/lysine/ornithine decarboxylase|nr:arginine decarboxylase [Solirubrobacteraceae bacterium]